MFRRIIFLFVLCCTVGFSQAQIDIAQVISGTYNVIATISTFEKDVKQKLDIKATLRVIKTGENKVRVSLSGVTSTYDATVERGGPQYISGDFTSPTMHATLALELGKPAIIRGRRNDVLPSKAGEETWWFEGQANNKPESLPLSEDIEEKKEDQPESSQQALYPPEKKPEPDKIIENPAPGRSLEPDPEAVKTGRHIFTLDGQGRPIRAEGWLYEEHGVRNKSAQKSVSGSFNTKFDPALQKKVPKVFDTKIHASHLIAKQFGGSGDKYNLLPTLREINLITIGGFEQLIATEMKSGQSVYLQVFISYNYTGNIPSSIIYKAFKSDGKKLIEFTKGLDITPNLVH